MVKETQINPLSETVPAPTEQSQCLAPAHHWIIESPRGELSKGRCQNCGNERYFRNFQTEEQRVLLNIRAKTKLHVHPELAILDKELADLELEQ